MYHAVGHSEDFTAYSRFAYARSSNDEDSKLWTLGENVVRWRNHLLERIYFQPAPVMEGICPIFARPRVSLIWGRALHVVVE
jgi:hypothetical protein